MPWTKIYADKSEFEKASRATEGLRGLTYKEALNEASALMLEGDKSVFLMGEGIDDAGGVFGSTKGLAERFGKERVMDTPLAENALTGIAMGAAFSGMRPMLIHMRVDFLPISLDQIMNHAAKWHYMFGGKVNVPLTIRSIIGRGWGSAAQHSQSLQAIFAHIPGLKVVMPATPYDAKGLLISSVYDGNPVIFIEHRWLYEHMGHVPDGVYRVPIGKALVRRQGTDATIVAVSQMVPESIKAADELSRDGIECEVVDLRTLRPLDTETLNNSIKKTGRLIIADIGWKMCGIGAEVIASATEAGIAFKSPPKRINFAETPTPASPALEKAYYPGKDDIVSAVRKLL